VRGGKEGTGATLGERRGIGAWRGVEARETAGQGERGRGARGAGWGQVAVNAALRERCHRAKLTAARGGRLRERGGARLGE
jgi:hypothetical protein